MWIIFVMFLDCYFHKKLSTINQKTISSFDMISYSENNNNNKTTTLSESEATREIMWIVIIKGHVNKAERAIESKRFPCEPKKGRRIRKTHPCYGQCTGSVWLSDWLSVETIETTYDLVFPSCLCVNQANQPKRTFNHPPNPQSPHWTSNNQRNQIKIIK